MQGGRLERLLRDTWDERSQNGHRLERCHDLVDGGAVREDGGDKLQGTEPRLSWLRLLIDRLCQIERGDRQARLVHALERKLQGLVGRWKVEDVQRRKPAKSVSISSRECFDAVLGGVEQIPKLHGPGNEVGLCRVPSSVWIGNLHVAAPQRNREKCQRCELHHLVKHGSTRQGRDVGCSELEPKVVCNHAAPTPCLKRACGRLTSANRAASTMFSQARVLRVR